MSWAENLAYSFPKGMCISIDHGTHISDLSIFVCLQCTYTKEVRVKHGMAKCPNNGSVVVHIIKYR